MPKPIYDTQQAAHATSEPSQPVTPRDATELHTSTLKQLDQQYQSLTKAEQSLEQYIYELQQEEKALRLALHQSSSSLKEQREKEKMKKDEEAVARLEGLLMGGDSSSDSDNQSDDLNEGNSEILTKSMN
jgi:predicted RNase H-like nuclease (RuvC/YqgF family)